jgi:predicted transcriptional regulator
MIIIYLVKINYCFGIDYIVNKGNHNKKFVLSIIKFLKEIGWLVQNENGKNIPIIK